MAHGAITIPRGETTEVPVSIAYDTEATEGTGICPLCPPEGGARISVSWFPFGSLKPIKQPGDRDVEGKGTLVVPLGLHPTSQVTEPPTVEITITTCVTTSTALVGVVIGRCDTRELTVRIGPKGAQGGGGGGGPPGKVDVAKLKALAAQADHLESVARQYEKIADLGSCEFLVSAGAAGVTKQLAKNAVRDLVKRGVLKPVTTGLTRISTDPATGRQIAVEIKLLPQAGEPVAAVGGAVGFVLGEPCSDWLRGVAKAKRQEAANLRALIKAVADRALASTRAPAAAAAGADLAQPSPSSVTPLAPGPNLDVESAAALNALREAQAGSAGLARALATTVVRLEAARRAGKAAQRSRQRSWGATLAKRLAASSRQEQVLTRRAAEALERQQAGPRPADVLRVAATHRMATPAELVSDAAPGARLTALLIGLSPQVGRR